MYKYLVTSFSTRYLSRYYLRVFLCRIHDADNAAPKVGICDNNKIILFYRFVIDKILAESKYTPVDDPDSMYKDYVRKSTYSYKQPFNGCEKLCYISGRRHIGKYTFIADDDAAALKYFNSKAFDKIDQQKRSAQNDFVVGYSKRVNPENCIFASREYANQFANYDAYLSSVYMCRLQESSVKYAKMMRDYQPQGLVNIKKFPIMLSNHICGRYQTPYEKLPILENLLPTSYSDLIQKFKYTSDTVLIIEYDPIISRTKTGGGYAHSYQNPIYANIPVSVELEDLLDKIYDNVNNAKNIATTRKVLSLDMVTDPQIQFFDVAAMASSFYDECLKYIDDTKVISLSGKEDTLYNLINKMRPTKKTN